MPMWFGRWRFESKGLAALLLLLIASTAIGCHDGGLLGSWDVTCEVDTSTCPSYPVGSVTTDSYQITKSGADYMVDGYGFNVGRQAAKSATLSPDGALDFLLEYSIPREPFRSRSLQLRFQDERVTGKDSHFYNVAVPAFPPNFCRADAACSGVRTGP
jgi:hypothetical protein